MRAFMSTVISVAIKECREAMLEGRFRWMVISIVLLLTGSLVTGWFHFEKKQQEREQEFPCRIVPLDYSGDFIAISARSKVKPRFTGMLARIAVQTYHSAKI